MPHSNTVERFRHIKALVWVALFAVAPLVLAQPPAQPAVVGAAAAPIQVNKLLDLVPADAAFIVAIPSLKALDAQIGAFVKGCGISENPSDVSLLALIAGKMGQDIDAMGIALDRPIFIFSTADFQGSGGVVTLADAAAFRKALSAVPGVSLAEVQWSGISYLVKQTPGPDGTLVGKEAIFIRGNIALIAQSEAALQRCLSSAGAEGPRLAQSLKMPPLGSMAVFIDMQRVMAQWSSTIDGALQMFEGMAAMQAATMGAAPQSPDSPSPAGQMGFNIQKAVQVEFAMLRAMISTWREVDRVEFVVSPSAEALEIQKKVLFREEGPAGQYIPAHSPRPFRYASVIPSNAVIAIDAHFQTEPISMLMTKWTEIIGNALIGMEPQARASYDQMMALNRQLFVLYRDEMAFAMSPGTGGIIPNTLTLINSSDAPKLLDLYTKSLTSSWTRDMMSVFFSGAGEAVKFTTEKPIVEEGRTIHHWRLSGLGEMMQAAAEAQAQAQTKTQPLPDLSALNAIDYWAACEGDTVIITTEAEPRTLREALAKLKSAGAAPVPAAPEAIAGRLAQSDGFFTLRPGRYAEWIGGVLGQMGMAEKELKELQAVSQAVSGKEQGIWAFWSYEPNGLKGSLVVPSADIRAIIEAVKAAKAPQPTS